MERARDFYIILDDVSLVSEFFPFISLAFYVGTIQ